MLDFARMMRFLPLDTILIVAFTLYAIWIVLVMCHHGMFVSVRRHITLLAKSFDGWLFRIDEDECPDWADEEKWRDSLC